MFLLGQEIALPAEVGNVAWTVQILSQLGAVAILGWMAWMAPKWMRSMAEAREKEMDFWANERKEERRLQNEERIADRQSRHETANLFQRSIVDIVDKFTTEAAGDRREFERRVGMITEAIERQTDNITDRMDQQIYYFMRKFGHDDAMAKEIETRSKTRKDQRSKPGEE